MKTYIFIALFVVLYLVQSARLKKLLKHFSALQESFQKLSEQQLFLIDNLPDNKSDNMASRKAYQIEKKEALLKLENAILTNPSKYYTQKNSCMNESEALLFYYIHQCVPIYNFKATNELNRSNYNVFPQVSFHAFFDLPAYSSDDMEDLPRRKLAAKNIDFLICHHNAEKKYKYTPVLMIEIDGSYHFTRPSSAANARSQQSDRLKDAIATDCKIPLFRYKLTNSRASHEDRAGIEKALKPFFENPDKFTSGIFYFDKTGAISKNEYYEVSL